MGLRQGETIPISVITVHLDDIANNVANTVKQAPIILPFDKNVIKKVLFACHAKAGGTDPTLDIFDEGIAVPATILSAAVTLAAADTIYEGTLGAGKGTYLAKRLLSVRAVTEAVAGAITNGTVTLVVEDGTVTS